MIYIGGFSGGIDSQAAARWMLNRYGAENVVLLNSDAGGNEHPLTIEHIEWYSANVHPVVRVAALVKDIDRPTPIRDAIAVHGMTEETTITFGDLAMLKGIFPAKMRQFCTDVLKLAPMRRWMRETYPDGDYCRFSGVRRDESQSRNGRQFTEWDDYFDCDLHNPIVDWTKQMAFDYCKAHGELVNPLYALGFSRVGCAPCVNSSKNDIWNWARRFPEMIDKVRGWEIQAGKTFFPAGMVPGVGLNWIDEVVDWAKTDRGGRQHNIFRVLNEPASCESKFGLCE